MPIDTFTRLDDYVWKLTYKWDPFPGLADNTVGKTIDTLLRHAIVVTTDGESFRMREAKTRPTTRRKT